MRLHILVCKRGTDPAHLRVKRMMPPYVQEGDGLVGSASTGSVHKKTDLLLFTMLVSISHSKRAAASRTSPGHRLGMSVGATGISWRTPPCALVTLCNRPTT